MKRKIQMSESLEVAFFLALSGGLMDAYSYLLRGGVFANAQTGNMLLFGVYISRGDFTASLKYLFPILSFALGISLAQIIRIKQLKKLHWRQVSLLIEIILLIIVSFLPSERNALANALTSFACGIQVQSFRKLNGMSFSTTMCIGNLRSATHELLEYFTWNNIQDLKRSIVYFFVIFSFVVGAVIGSKFSTILNLKTILISPVFLAISVMIMFINNEVD